MVHNRSEFIIAELVDKRLTDCLKDDRGSHREFVQLRENIFAL
jgi:hypothetical protein